MAEKKLRLLAVLKAWLIPFRYGLERWSYTLQRITGVVVAFYFMAHIIETGYIVGGPNVWSIRPDARSYAERVWSETLQFLRNPLFDAGLVVVGVMLAFHTINGIRLFLAHFGWGLGKPTRPEYPYHPPSMSPLQRLLFWASLLFSLFTAIYAIDAFFKVI